MIFKHTRLKPHIPTLTYILKGLNTSSGRSLSDRTQGQKPTLPSPLYSPPTLQSHPPGVIAMYLIHTAKSLFPPAPDDIKKTKQITYFL